ncbi:MAG TPA: SURF1 family protein [Rhizobiaceae bacterium]|nr:SURF1 family protein [Rhizobiaceae bacterium]
MNAEAPADRGFPWLALLFGALAFAALIGLGTWQVQRLHWKEGLIQAIETRSKAEPKPFADVEREFAETGDVDYVATELSGRFDHAHESHFFATWKGATGFYIYTPLLLDDGRAVLVNRGFVPYEQKDPATRAQGQVEGVVAIRGLARNPLAGKPSSMLPDNEPDRNIFYWKDMAAMATLSGIETSKLVPFFIDADAAANPGGLPAGGVTLIDLPNNHLQYAVTWYGLAAALAGVLGVWLWRRRSAA